MKIERMLTDVNLSDISFPAGNSKVVLSFLNMSDGGVAGLLVCSGLVVFAYETSMGNGLPQYVGEVNHAGVSSNELADLLQRLGYGFRESQSGALTSEATPMHHVHIEGGVSIEIVCAEVQLLPL